MPRVVELFKSGEGTTSLKPRGSNSVLLYLVKDAADEFAARTSALNVTPAVWDGKILRNVAIERLAPTKWLARCSYDDNEPPLDIGEWRISFDTTGGTVHKTVATAERRYPATAADQKMAINVQDGRVQGVEWPTGTLQLSITYRQPRAVITVAYARTLARLVGKVNDAIFYGHQPRELLFLGARGQQGSAIDPEVTYHFLSGEHLEDFELGGIEVALKEAHEYLWCKFADAVDDTGDEMALVQKPVAIYVNRVADEADFSLMAIGTGA